MYKKVNSKSFTEVISKMKTTREDIAKSLSDFTAKDYNKMKAKVFLSKDKLSGFAITNTKEIISLFSLIKGKGKELIENAVIKGGNNLNCFDGYLSSFYKNNGFEEIKREKNYNGKNFPDVVFLAKIGGIK